MTNMKTLMLAAAAALTLGTGAAMAQEQGGPSFAPLHWSLPTVPGTPEHATSLSTVNRDVQFGSSDAVRNEDFGMRAYEVYNPYAGGN